MADCLTVEDLAYAIRLSWDWISILPFSFCLFIGYFFGSRSKALSDDDSDEY